MPNWKISNMCQMRNPELDNIVFCAAHSEQHCKHKINIESHSNWQHMKTLLQLWSAVVTLALGHLLVYLDFFARGYVHGNTLMYFGQCLIYAGIALGVKLYIDYLTNRNHHATNQEN